MAGTITDPMAAVVAGEEPEMAAKNMEARTVIWARPPVKLPTRELANLTRRSEIPPLDITFPARIKKGIAIMGKELTALNITWGAMDMSTVVKVQIEAKAAIPRAMAMGTPITNKRAKTPNKKRAKLITSQ
jgi:hypothetical protein